jgi:ankyrin repeat protein
LHQAVWLDRVDIAQQLVNQKAKIDAKDDFQQTPLQLAVWGNHEKVAELLIENKADIEVRDTNNVTTNVPWRKSSKLS